MNRKEQMKIKLDENAIQPTRAHETDAGLDLYSPIRTIVPARKNDFWGTLQEGSVAIDTGVHIELPHNTVGFLKSKSGLNVKSGITSEGVIDEGYTGSIVVKLYNHSDKDVEIRKGQKITQLVVLPCLYVDVEVVKELGETSRGDNGFGSSGE